MSTTNKSGSTYPNLAFLIGIFFFLVLFTGIIGSCSSKFGSSYSARSTSTTSSSSSSSSSSKSKKNNTTSYYDKNGNGYYFNSDGSVEVTDGYGRVVKDTNGDGTVDKVSTDGGKSWKTVKKK